MNHFFAFEFYLHFSGKSQSVGLRLDFAGSKTLQKVMKITRFDVLRGPFIYRDQASKREPKIMQNDAKMHLKSSQNDHQKIWKPVLQWLKMHVVAWRAKVRQNALIYVVLGVALLPPWTQKSLKIVENSTQNYHKKCEARSCNGQKRKPSSDLQKCIRMRSFFSFPV